MSEGHAERNRRKVVFVLPHFEAGGVERIVLNLLIHLDRSRFQPGLVLFDERGSLLERLPADVERRGLGGAKARRLPPRLAAAFDAMGAEVVYGGTNAANIASLAAARLMARPPAVVVGEHTPLGPFLDDAKMRLLRLPLMRWLYPRAAAVAVPAAPLGAELRRVLRRPDLPVVTLPNPVLEQWPRPADPSAAAAGPLFLAAGRLAPEKGFDILIDAFARLGSHFPDARLTICGDGPERPALVQLCRRLNLADRMDLPGYVPDPIGRLGQGRIFVLSSRREGFPNVLIEALAAGLPIVAADCPVGPRLALDDGACGLLVRARDAGALAEGMARLARDGELAAHYRRRGPERAAPYGVQTAARAFARLFEDVATRRAAGGGTGVAVAAAPAPARRRGGAPARLLAAGMLSAVVATGPRQALAADGAKQSYELAAGDSIAVTAFGRTDLNGEYPIGRNGRVRLPLLGPVPAAGRTIDDLQGEIKATLSRILDYEAPVTVSVATYRPVFVVGDVSAPGEFIYTPGMKVLHAYAKAGGTPSLRRLPQPVASRVADAQRELQLARNELTALLIRGAALDAALAGATELTLPPELESRADAPMVQDLVAREESLLQAEKASLDEQIDRVRKQQAHLDDEIRALERQIAALVEQVATIEDELGKIEGLASRGLATSSRLLDLRRIAASTKSARYDATAYLSRARRQVVELDSELEALRKDRRQELLRERREVGVETAQARARLDGARQALAALSEASPNQVVEGSGEVTFLITRIEDGAATMLAADQSTPLEPGDVVEVRVDGEGEAGRVAASRRLPDDTALR